MINSFLITQGQRQVTKNQGAIGGKMTPQCHSISGGGEMRYKCANCGYVFDGGVIQNMNNVDIRCPHCNSNAVDPKPGNYTNDKELSK